jgi:hypothetical protein
VSETPTNGLERLRHALASAEASGVGCHYWTQPTLGVPVDQLAAFGLVQTIKQRIPLCEDHACPIVETCAERAIFAEARPGRAGLKFRLTELGRQASADPALIVANLTQQPVPARILTLLTDAGQPMSSLDLYWRLLAPELETLAETGQRPTPPLSRPAARLFLDLLIAADLLVEDIQAGTLTVPSEI